MTKHQAVLSLCLCGIIWGFGFVATVWGLRELTSMQFLMERALLALLVGLPFVFIYRPKNFFNEIKLSFVPGMLLALMLIFQTEGLQTTTATNSGFITSLYVVILPILHFIFSRHKPSKIILLSIVLACAGTFWLSGGSLTTLNYGDGLTLICAFFGALQILSLAKLSLRSSNAFVFNYFQTMWCAVLVFPFVIKTGPLYLSSTPLIWIGIAACAIGSTLIAFSLQVQAQRVLSPAPVSLLCLLEAPFAMGFGILLLNENLTLVQLLGAILIFSAAVLAVLSELRPNELSAMNPKKISQ